MCLPNKIDGSSFESGFFSHLCWINTLKSQSISLDAVSDINSVTPRVTENCSYQGPPTCCHVLWRAIVRGLETTPMGKWEKRKGVFHLVPGSFRRLNGCAIDLKVYLCRGRKRGGKVIYATGMVDSCQTRWNDANRKCNKQI